MSLSPIDMKQKQGHLPTIFADGKATVHLTGYFEADEDEMKAMLIVDR